MRESTAHSSERPVLRLVNGGCRPLRVAVIGGGIAGLASAHVLAKAGHRPVVLEAFRQVGGVGAHFEHCGVTLDRWPHVIHESDAELMDLISDLGLADQLRWSEARTGFLVDGDLYGMNGALDLLRFRALGLADRLRAGLGALYLATVNHQGNLDDVRAIDWLRRVFGPRVVERVLHPLLRARFGDGYVDLPAYWMRTALNREKNGSQEAKAALRCGHRGLMEALYDAVVVRGGEVRMSCSVRGLEETAAGIRVVTARGSERFDAAVSTLPLPLLARLTQGALGAAVPLPDLAYRGMVNALVVSGARLERFYRTAVMDRRFPFHGIVETTHVIPPCWLGGRHLYYLANYCDAGSNIYRRSDDIVAGEAIAGLGALYSGFRRRDVEAVYVFRAPHVEPLWTVGYLRRPLPRVGRSRLYVCATEQVYPGAVAWNTRVAQAAETVTALLGDLGRSAAAAG